MAILGKLHFNKTGAWKISTAYKVDDMVRYHESTWLCKVAHTSSSANHPEATAQAVWQEWSPGFGQYDRSAPIRWQMETQESSTTINSWQGNASTPAPDTIRIWQHRFQTGQKIVFDYNPLFLAEYDMEGGKQTIDNYSRKTTRPTYEVDNYESIGIFRKREYYVIKVDANSIKLALTKTDATNGTAITLTDSNMSSGADKTLPMYLYPEEYVHWNKEETYEPGDIVKYHDTIFISKTSHSGQVPIHTDYEYVYQVRQVGGVYQISTDGGATYVTQAELNLVRGNTYYFDLSDASLATHPFKLSTLPDGAISSGLKIANISYAVPWNVKQPSVYSGTPSEYSGPPTQTDLIDYGQPAQGTAGAYLRIYVTEGFHYDTFYYYCDNHPNMGGKMNVEDLREDIERMNMGINFTRPITDRYLQNYYSATDALYVYKVRWIFESPDARSVTQQYNESTSEPREQQGFRQVSSRGRFQIDIGDGQGWQRWEELKWIPGKAYKFDLSDISMERFSLKFSTTADGTHGGGVAYTSNVSEGGTPGQKDAFIQINTSATVPGTNIDLYLYSPEQKGAGIKFRQIRIGMIDRMNRTYWDIVARGENDYRYAHKWFSQYGMAPEIQRDGAFRQEDSPWGDPDAPIYVRSLTFDATTAGGIVAGNSITIPDHKLETGQPVRYLFPSGGSGIMTGGTGAIKYIIKLNNNTIQIATNETNAINGTAEGLFAQGTAGTNNVNNFHAIVEERLPCSPGDKLGYASEGNGAGQNHSVKYITRNGGIAQWGRDYMYNLQGFHSADWSNRMPALSVVNHHDWEQGLLPTPDGAPPKCTMLLTGWRSMLALFNNGEVHHVGYTGHGQNGIGDDSWPEGFVRVGYDGARRNRGLQMTFKGKKCVRIASSMENGDSTHHNCALIENERGTLDLYTWGYNEYGQCGHDFTGNHLGTPRQVEWDEGRRGRIIDVWAKGGSYGSTYVLTDYGRMYTCGYNAHGELGLGDTSNRDQFETSTALNFGISDTQSDWSKRPRKFVMYGFHNVKTCAMLQANNQVITWGRNDYGQTGNGGTSTRSTPGAVTDYLNATPSDVVNIWGMGGDRYSCLYMSRGTSKDDNYLWATGYNSYQYLMNSNRGNNTTYTFTDFSGNSATRDTRKFSPCMKTAESDSDRLDSNITDPNTDASRNITGYGQGSQGNRFVRNVHFIRGCGYTGGNGQYWGGAIYSNDPLHNPGYWLFFGRNSGGWASNGYSSGDFDRRRCDPYGSSDNNIRRNANASIQTPGVYSPEEFDLQLVHDSSSSISTMWVHRPTGTWWCNGPGSYYFPNVHNNAQYVMSYNPYW